MQTSPIVVVSIPLKFSFKIVMEPLLDDLFQFPSPEFSPGRLYVCYFTTKCKIIRCSVPYTK